MARINKYGTRISLRDDLADIITDNFPAGKENDSFLKSQDFDKLLNKLVDFIKDHVDSATSDITS